ncbi:MAG: glycosyltransferase family 4 protein [Candidatus Paceibacterota bacterium]
MTPRNTVCYFGIYDPQFGRNRVYQSGLRAQGVTVLECRDTSRGFLKFWRLWRKHGALRGKYDALVVGYPGHLVVPLARLISRKPVIADMLGSLADAEAHSHKTSIVRRVESALIDRLALWCADVVLLESEAQRQYFQKRYGASEKYRVLYTGADEAVFTCDGLTRDETFTVLFRGRLTGESGILHILRAALLLKGDKSIRFRVLGSGQLFSETKAFITKHDLTSVELVQAQLPPDTLREKMCGASLALGQFEQNPRLSRTIPHKAFEALALGIPYLTGDAPAIREIAEDGVSCFLVPLADPAALAKKILVLAGDPTLCAHVGEAGRQVFEKRFSASALGAELVQILRAARGAD